MDDSIDGQALTDDASGKRQDFFAATTYPFRQSAAAQSSILYSGFASTSIGVAGIDEQVTRHATSEMLLSNDDRRGAKCVAGEYCPSRFRPTQDPRDLGSVCQRQARTAGFR